MDMVRVDVDTDVEAHPVLHIGRWETYSNPKRELMIPAEMMQQLDAAQQAVEQAQADIMRYLAAHHDYPDIREWVADH